MLVCVASIIGAAPLQSSVNSNVNRNVNINTNRNIDFNSIYASLFNQLNSNQSPLISPVKADEEEIAPPTEPVKAEEINSEGVPDEKIAHGFPNRLRGSSRNYNSNFNSNTNSNSDFNSVAASLFAQLISNQQISVPEPTTTTKKPWQWHPHGGQW